MIFTVKRLAFASPKSHLEFDNEFRLQKQADQLIDWVENGVFIGIEKLH